MQSFIEFLKDYQIYPKLISARDLFYIFNESCESESNPLFRHSPVSPRVAINEMGELFKFSKFVQALIIISRRVFPKLKKIDYEN
jgi:hypothetical protein